MSVSRNVGPGKPTLISVQTAGAGPSKIATPVAEPQDIVDMGWEDDVVESSAKATKHKADEQLEDEEMLEYEREEAQVSRI